MEFSGKSGVHHEIDISEPRLAKIVRKCQELPGQELFQYVDEQGDVHDVGSSDVNEYLREISGEDFTAKDFRTWAGLLSQPKPSRNSKTSIQRLPPNAMSPKPSNEWRERLGNTKAVCRKCYIHPAVVDAYMDRSLLETLKNRAETELQGYSRLPAEEAAVLALLQQRMKLAIKHDPGRRIDQVSLRTLSDERVISQAYTSGRSTTATARAIDWPGRIWAAGTVVAKRGKAGQREKAGRVLAAARN